MENTPLERPALTFRPLSREETAALRGFVEKVRRLGHMRFFRQVPKTASMTFDEKGLRSEMEEPDDEALRAAITEFRQIYSPNEPHSFRMAMTILKRSAHERGGPSRDEAIALFDGHVRAERQALTEGIGVGIFFEEGERKRQVDTKTIVDAYFHGQYLHSGNEKSELARRLDGLQPWARYTLYSVMLVLRNVYWNAANAVDRVLAVPELLDADP